MRSLPNVLLVVSLLAYAVSFFLPVMDLKRRSNGQPTETSRMTGYEAFGHSFKAMVALGPEEPFPMPMWLSNPFYWGAVLLLMLRWYRLSLISCMIAITLSGWLILGRDILIGCHLWLGAMVLLMAASLIQWQRAAQRTDQPADASKTSDQVVT